MEIREINWPIIVIVMFILLFFGWVCFFLNECGIIEEISSSFSILGKPF